MKGTKVLKLSCKIGTTRATNIQNSSDRLLSVPLAEPNNICKSKVSMRSVLFPILARATYVAQNLISTIP